MKLVEIDNIFQFHSWNEVSEVIREIRDRCSKIEASVQEMRVEASVQEMPGVIPVDRLKEMMLIKKRINQLSRQFEVVDRSVNFLKTVPKAGKEAKAVEKKFNELYKTFKELKERIERDFLGQAESENR